MTYKDYILQLIDEDSPVGDVARDIAEDPKFPETNDYEDLDYYLTIQNSSCDSFMRVFERTYNDFQSL